MPGNARDMSRLWDMLDAARTASLFVQGMSFDEFLRDRKTRNAVERNLEILGEAASKIDGDTREAYPDIPWRSIIGLRNILIHEYGEIRYEILWAVLEEKLPPLILLLEKTGADDPPE